MIRINIYEAKTHFSKYIDRVAKGETILLCRRNEPIAEIRPVPAPRRKERPLGLARGEFEVPDAFLEPLPDEMIDSFEGNSQ